MGRAIDMESDISKLKIKVETIEGALKRVIESVDRLESKSSTTKHIDLVEDVKPSEIEEEQSVNIKDVERACEDALDELAEKDAMRVESEMVSGDNPQPLKDELEAANAAAPKKKSAKSNKDKK